MKFRAARFLLSIHHSFRARGVGALVAWILFSGAVYGADAFKGFNRKQPAAVAPIVVNPKASLERDRENFHKKWLERVVLAPFRQRIGDSPNQKEIGAFVEEAVSSFAKDCCCEWPEKLAADGNRLLKTGEEDPLFVYLAARAIHRIEDRAEDTLPRFTLAFQRAEKIKLAAAVTRFIAVEIARLAHTGVDKPKWDAKAGELAVAALTEGNYTPEESPIFLRHMLECPGSDHFERAPEAFAKAARSDKLPIWARHTLTGYIETGRAWAERGGDWGHEVSEKGWKGFRQHLKAAREELVKAWKLRPDQPYAAAGMITIVMGGDRGAGETERLWFDRATAGQFDYSPAYEKLLHAMLPRWGGSHQAMYQFGQACRATGRYDTEVPRMFMQACNRIAADFDDWRDVYRGGSFPGIGREIVDHHEKLLAEPSRETLRWMDRSFYAINAWLVEEYSAAEKALSELPEGLYPPAADKLRRLGLSPGGFRSTVALMSGAARAPYLAGEKLYLAGDFAGARPHFQEALGKAAPAGASHVQARLDAIEVHERLEKNEWVKVPIAPGLSGWREIYGEWIGTADGEVAIEGKGSKGMIVYELSAAPDYELKADVRIEGTGTTDRAAGLAVGYLGFENYRNLWAGFWWEPKKPQYQATLFRGFGLEKAPVKTIKFEDRNKLHVRVIGGKVTFEVNGLEVFRNLPVEHGEPSAEGALFGFASYDYSRGAKTIYSDVQIRRIRDGK